MTNPNETTPGLPREEKIYLAGLIILAGFIAAVLWAYIQGVYWGKPYPYNTFLFKPNDRFMDFLNPMYAVVEEERVKGQVELFGYCPFYYLICKWFSVLPVRGALWTFFVGFLGFFIVSTYRQLRCNSFFLSAIFCLITLLSYPFLYSVDRMNSEALLYMCLFAFAFLYQRQRYNWAVFALAVAIACKPFPGVFGLLLLVDKRFKDIVKLGVITLALTGLAMWVLQGGIAGNLKSMLASWKGYQEIYATNNGGFHLSHSLWALLKFSFYGWPPGYGEAGDQVGLTLPGYYQVLAMVILGAVGWHLLRYETIYWKKIALLVCCMNLLPFVSSDYKLLHLFVPFFLFVNAPRARRDAFYAILFAILFIPKPYYRLPSFPEATIAIPVNALTMLIMLIMILYEGKKKTAGMRAEG